MLLFRLLSSQEQPKNQNPLSCYMSFLEKNFFLKIFHFTTEVRGNVQNCHFLCPPPHIKFSKNAILGLFIVGLIPNIWLPALPRPKTTATSDSWLRIDIRRGVTMYILTGHIRNILKAKMSIFSFFGHFGGVSGGVYNALKWSFLDFWQTSGPKTRSLAPFIVG